MFVKLIYTLPFPVANRNAMKKKKFPRITTIASSAFLKCTSAFAFLTLTTGRDTEIQPKEKNIKAITNANI